MKTTNIPRDSIVNIKNNNTLTKKKYYHGGKHTSQK